MSEYHEEQWGEMARLSRRIVLVEQMLLRRILALEAEVAALKSAPAAQTQDGRTVYQDAREIEWREDGAALAAIDGIMQR
jgi:hypothetical protein